MFALDDNGTIVCGRMAVGTVRDTLKSQSKRALAEGEAVETFRRELTRVSQRRQNIAAMIVVWMSRMLCEKA
ncbi:hypothetical protein PM082_017721 [Marasmius tenuissimus]|nr:hypothetical protein PM082_017721 [Marasmius tenuissimus]